VTTPAGYAERTLEIIGHDEIDFSGGIRTQATSATFSSIRVEPGGTPRLAHTTPPVRIVAYETIVVGGDPRQARRCSGSDLRLVVSARGFEPVTSAVSTNRPVRTTPHQTVDRIAKPQVRASVLLWSVIHPKAS
jgi:hypothetical protein